MCLIVFAYREIPGIDLVLVSNRDERFDRPAAYAHEWSDPAGIVCGKDLEAGGTWLGVSRTGRLAAITNIREERKPAPEAASRGELPVRFLSTDENVVDFRNGLGDLDRYNGFNMLVFDGRSLGLFSNRSNEILHPEPGYHGISNGPLASEWPKVAAGKDRLRENAPVIDFDADSLLRFMQDTRSAPDDRLPNTGVGIELERVLSCPFIISEGYGTRCTTIVRMYTEGGLTFDEYSYDGSTKVVNHEYYRFM